MKDRFALVLLALIGITLLGLYYAAREEGHVVLGTPGVELHLRGGLRGNVSLCSGAEPIAVPARTYAATSLSLTRRLGDDTWRMSGRDPGGELARIGVYRGRTTTVDLGPPLLIDPQVEIHRRQVYIRLGIYGRAGEKYTNVISKNGRRISGPEVRIMDATGAVLASGRFRYG